LAFKLDNNEIEKIEGLETLVNLIELSLGGNKIKKIKKLDTLSKL
jgi:Leucine-rich repeat (LRR) protein